MNWIKPICLGLYLGWATAGTASGAGFNMDVKASGIQLGESLMGPKLAAEDYKGRVVLLDFWSLG